MAKTILWITFVINFLLMVFTLLNGDSINEEQLISNWAIIGVIAICDAIENRK